MPSHLGPEAIPHATLPSPFHVQRVAQADPACRAAALDLALGICAGSPPAGLDLPRAARLLRLAGLLGAPELVEAVVGKIRAFGLAAGAGDGDNPAALLPAVIWIGEEDIISQESRAMAEALAAAVRSIGGAALRALDRCGVLRRDAADRLYETGVWIVPTADGGRGQGLAAEAGRGAAVAAGGAGAAEEGVECYPSFDALAGARLDIGNGDAPLSPLGFG